MTGNRSGAPATPIERLLVRGFDIATETPEADGTLEWTSTGVVLVQVEAAGRCGLGYTYSGRGAVETVAEALASVVLGADAFDSPSIWRAMVRKVRNLGRPGVCACAISAVDAALWDLKARLMELPLCRLLGRVRSDVPIYGSGGFTNYDVERLCAQLAGFVTDLGCRWVKMKVGADPQADPDRIAAARQAADGASLMIDANGAYQRKSALRLADFCADLGVVWFEEPLSSDDLEGLAWLQANGPAGVEIAAGEYGYDPWYFRSMLQAGAVDVLQADASRCLGPSGFLRAGALAEGFQIPLSAHCAPALHLHVATACPALRNIEWFFDHARIEAMLFDGAPVPRDGAISPDLSRPGLGLDLKHADVDRLAADGREVAAVRTWSP